MAYFAESDLDQTVALDDIDILALEAVIRTVGDIRLVMTQTEKQSQKTYLARHRQKSKINCVRPLRTARNSIL